MITTTDRPLDSPATRLFLLPYVTSVLLGAGLLFSLEPMVGKLVLPKLGGVPAVWNTCLLFFQGMLLAGYAYTHYGVRALGVRRHALVHTALLVVSLFVLPVRIDAAPPVDASPVGWLLLALLRSIGLPFLVLSATAPLVQYWLAGTRHAASRDPYFLYAASNLGSLVGLAAYPLLIEPVIGLRAQAIGWTLFYLAFACTMGLLAWYARTPLRDLAPPPRTEPVPILTGLKWAGIAFIPSALLLTVTGYVTTDIAPMPLLWLLPLGLYLITFVVAFATRTGLRARTLRVLQPIATLALIAVIVVGLKDLWLLPLHLVVLTVVSYLAHARLAAERPHTSDLTTFYLWISVGGTLGGVFGAILAPLLLMPEFEYILLLPVALLLGGSGRTMRRTALTYAAAVGLAILALAFREYVTADTILRERNFFGTLRVTRIGDWRVLMHGRILHGAQLSDPTAVPMPTTHYTRAGPFGDIFRDRMAGVNSARIAVVGLGPGAIACYARPGDVWHMFEIDPDVVRIATDPSLFTFLRDCTPSARIFIGDGRHMLERLRTEPYDLIVLDAFSSDAIPAHMLTREAFELYFERLKPDGILALHISNRFLDLAPVVAANAAELRAFALVRDDSVSDPPRHMRSRWIVLATERARLEPLAQVAGWNRLVPDRSVRVWTDDYTSLLPIMRVLR